MPATQEPKDLHLSAGDIPELIQASKCALPLIFTLLETPESPGTRGTCTALRAGDRTFFVTAAHVVEGSGPEVAVEVATSFRDRQERCRIRDILIPRPASEIFEEVCDFAVMQPLEAAVFIDGYSAAYDLSRVVKMDAISEKALFAVCGYPSGAPGRNFFDYDEKRITFGLHAAIGVYAGPSLYTGHHLLEVSTADCGGPDGMSGGPVFRLKFNRMRNSWDPVLAGIVTRGGPDRVHFIDVAFLDTFIVNEMANQQ